MTDIFKTKEELIEYINNVGIEYRYSCYSDRNPEGERNCLVVCLPLSHDFMNRMLFVGRIHALNSRGLQESLQSLRVHLP